MMPGPIIYGPSGEQVADLRGELLVRDERTANVRLIIAAPELLAALKHLETAATKFTVGCNCQTAAAHDALSASLEIARAAIRKATGAE